MILVTGGTGLVGSHLLRHLVQLGSKIRATRRPDSNLHLIADIAHAIEWVDADLEEPQSLYEAMQGIEQLYHCAALISYAPTDADEMRRINRQGTANVVDMALQAGIKKMVYVSSIAALGRSVKHRDVNEETPWHDSRLNSNYAISKMLAEREAWRGIAEGLDTVIVNPSIIIGRGDWQTSSCRLITRIYKGLRFYTNGGTGFVDVLDLVAIMHQLMNSPITNQRFVVSAENWSYKDFFTAVAQNLHKQPPTIAANKLLSSLAWRLEALKGKITGSKPLITRETARNAREFYLYDNQKVKKALNFTFRPLSQTIQRVCKEFLDDNVKG
jgi:dihydroflavonol-4-reductase